MGKLWLNNEFVDRLAMLQQTEATHPGINQVAIEKDWWVTVTLKALFQTDCRDSLIFKGGTSLSKGFNIIERFSEDIDLAISHSFFGVEKTNKSQRDKLKKLARKYIQETLVAQLDEQLKSMGITGYTIENITQVQDKNGEWKPIDSDKDPTVILLHYPSIVEDTISYIPPRVKIEISCLSMDEPTEERYIHSLIGETFEEEDIDANCKIRTVVPTRTFLEKIFLLAEEFQKDKLRRMKFKFVSPVTTDDIYSRLQPVLMKKYGNAMQFDREDDTIVVRYDEVIYDINPNEDGTVSIWWRKSLAGAFLRFREGKLYRKIRTGTALIAYELQQQFGVHE